MLSRIPAGMERALMPALQPRSPNAQPAAVPAQPSAIRRGLVPRVIYFPEGLLARIETRPGALVELLTMALAAHLKGGAQ